MIPARLSWAVSMLPLEAASTVLEIGCGRGVALGLVCDRLPHGRVTGLDRSPVAIAAARARHRARLRSGTLRLVRAALVDARLDGPFDLAFAVNVNLFWLKPARELAVVRRLLAPGGALYLFYEPPSDALARRTVERCSRLLPESDFAVVEVIGTDLRPSVGLCIIAKALPDTSGARLKEEAAARGRAGTILRTGRRRSSSP